MLAPNGSGCTSCLQADQTCISREPRKKYGSSNPSPHIAFSSIMRLIFLPFLHAQNSHKSKTSVSHKLRPSLSQISIPHGVDLEGRCWNALCSLSSEMIRLILPPQIESGCDLCPTTDKEDRIYASCMTTRLSTGIHTENWRQNPKWLLTVQAECPVSQSDSGLGSSSGSSQTLSQFALESE